MHRGATFYERGLEWMRIEIVCKCGTSVYRNVPTWLVGERMELRCPVCKSITVVK